MHQKQREVENEVHMHQKQREELTSWPRMFRLLLEMS